MLNHLIWANEVSFGLFCLLPCSEMYTSHSTALSWSARWASAPCLCHIKTAWESIISCAWNIRVQANNHKGASL